MLPVFIIQTVAEDSLMQFEKASDLDFAHAQGASRTNRMQLNTQAMEDQWKSVLQQVVESGSWNDPKTGNPWVPNKKDMLEPVQDVISDMELELEGQKDLNTYIMGNHSQEIVNCNNVRDAALAGAVTTAKNAMVAARTTHSECRDDEDDAIDKMEQQCKAFDDLKKCGHEQDWFAAYHEGGTGEGTLAAVVGAAVTCKAGIAGTKGVAERCDGDQTDFTTAFCDYKGQLDETCSAHDECYNTQTGNWDQAQKSISQLETEQKTIFRMLGRIRCYLSLLFDKADSVKTPTQADIAACQGSAIDDASLTVDYSSKAPRGQCYDAPAVSDESVTNAPGSDAWYDGEFSSMKTHGKLNPNTQEC